MSDDIGKYNLLFHQSNVATPKATFLAPVIGLSFLCRQDFGSILWFMRLFQKVRVQKKKEKVTLLRIAGNIFHG